MASLFKKKKIPNLTEAEFLDFVKRIKGMQDSVDAEFSKRKSRKMFGNLKKALEVK